MSKLRIVIHRLWNRKLYKRARECVVQMIDALEPLISNTHFLEFKTKERKDMSKLPFSLPVTQVTRERHRADLEEVFCLKKPSSRNNMLEQVGLAYASLWGSHLHISHLGLSEDERKVITASLDRVDRIFWLFIRDVRHWNSSTIRGMCGCDHSTAIDQWKRVQTELGKYALAPRSVESIEPVKALLRDIQALENVADFNFSTKNPLCKVCARLNYVFLGLIVRKVGGGLSGLSMFHMPDKSSLHILTLSETLHVSYGQVVFNLVYRYPECFFELNHHRFPRFHLTAPYYQQQIDDAVGNTIKDTHTPLHDTYAALNKPIDSRQSEEELNHLDFYAYMRAHIGVHAGRITPTIVTRIVRCGPFIEKPFPRVWDMLKHISYKTLAEVIFEFCQDGHPIPQLYRWERWFCCANHTRWKEAAGEYYRGCENPSKDGIIKTKPNHNYQWAARYKKDCSRHRIQDYSTECALQ